ncbi:MAG: Pr6Pr family membrane protein [Clostridia bacterium]|nr:Pr6Pr family membrane protein [Clostridia bacterium]
MLAVHSSLSSRLGTVLCALIVIACVIGLTMHRDFYALRLRKDFFCFYTNVSNLIVLIYFAAVSPRLYASQSLHPLIPHAEFAVTMQILLTLSVFHLVLFPAVRETIRKMPRTRAYMIVCTDNLFIHYLVPLGVLAYWLLCSPGKETLTYGDALYWMAIPTLYAAYIFIRAPRRGIIEEAGSPYPYPFMDVQALGTTRVAAYCALLYAAGTAAGLFIITTVRAVCAFPG